MRDLNKAIFTGRLVADPELRYLASTSMAHVSVAVAINSVRGSGDAKKEHVDFIEIAVYGKLAENLAKYKRKGALILIEGRLAQQRWDDKATGAKRSKVGVIADDITFLGSPASPQSEVPPGVREAFLDAAPVDEGKISF